jgi:hypothetical protein
VIERSLGAPQNFDFVYARARLIELAAELGIRVPQTNVVYNASELNEWINRYGLTTVLKANGTSSSDGVKVVRTAEEAHRALRKLQQPPLLARALKRAVVDRDTTLLIASMLRRGHTVNAQPFIAGREATSAVACYEGKVLASLHFEVISKVKAAGHATVIRRIDNQEMQIAAEKLVCPPEAIRRAWSGLHDRVADRKRLSDRNEPTRDPGRTFESRAGPRLARSLVCRSY